MSRPQPSFRRPILLAFAGSVLCHALILLDPPAPAPAPTPPLEVRLQAPAAAPELRLKAEATAGSAEAATPPPKQPIESPRPPRSDTPTRPARSTPPTPPRQATPPASWQEAMRQHLRRLDQAGQFYPREAIARGQQGEVLVFLMLDAEGKVIASRVEESSGFPLLDEAALRAVRSVETLPGAPRQTLLPVRFRLR